MKSLVGVLVGVFVAGINCFYAAPAKAPQLADPEAVKLLGKLPSGTMVLFDGRKLFQFTGSYRKAGEIIIKGALRSAPRKSVSDYPQYYVAIGRRWPALQRKAAALGANAVIITGEDAYGSGFVTHHGVSGGMEQVGVVTYDAVTLQGVAKEVVEIAQEPPIETRSLKSQVAQNEAPAT
jgi:hypothetical protein